MRPVWCCTRGLVARRSLTTLELCLLWSGVGAVLYLFGRRQARKVAAATLLPGHEEA